MDVEEKLSLIMRFPTEEVLTGDELRQYLETGHQLRHYIGFEISGFVHIGTGIISMSKLVDLQRAGVKVSILLADVHSWLNDKLGGNMDAIQRAAMGYFGETLKKSIEVLGGDPGAVDFILASNMFRENENYWYQVLDLARQVTVSDAKHSLTIMGRKYGESARLAWLIYPLMQVVDVYSLGTHIAQGGMDQRKAYVLARDVWDKIRLMPLRLGDKNVKPIILLPHLIPALNIKGTESREELSEAKMSKSKPDTALFLHDSPEEVRRKISNAYCPAKVIDGNPVLDLARVFSFRGTRQSPFIIEKPPQFGGGKLEFWTFEELAKSYEAGAVHPMDLKKAVAEEAVKAMEPFHKWFTTGPGASLLEQMRQLMPRSSTGDH